MRFSASVQDLRSVILLRRQLASELPRRKPWLRLGGGRASAFPIWRRDWQSLLRWPAVRVVRVVVIAVAAGAIAVAGFSQTPVLFVLVGPLMFIAALDLIEPLAQENEHPSRRDLLPLRPVTVMGRHLVAPTVGCAVVAAIATAAAAAIGGHSGLALGVGAVSVVPIALLIAAAAAFSATNDPYEFVLVPALQRAATAGPIVVATLAALPAFAAWLVVGGHLGSERGSNSAAIGAALATDVVLVILFFVAYGLLTWRFTRQEREAM
jgi:hypothetical protein